MSLLSIQNLSIRYPTADGTVHAVNDLSLELKAGEALGIVGESGSGKSQTALAILGLLERNAQVEGRIEFEGALLTGLSENALRRIRGARIGMVFQDPMTSLNPHLRVDTQMAEMLTQHRGMAEGPARAECARMLDAVRLPEVRASLRKYPHQLSGGQRQRVMIAMTLLCQPSLLICDEPTTALDVTVQAQILDLLAQLRRDFSLGLLFISHDLGVVGEVCGRVLVMYAGRTMESGPAAALLSSPTHPYTQALLASRPSLSGDRHAPLAAIAGQPPDPRQPREGCAFEPRCPRAQSICGSTRPALSTLRGSSRYCHVV